MIYVWIVEYAYNIKLIGKIIMFQFFVDFKLKKIQVINLKGTFGSGWAFHEISTDLRIPYCPWNRDSSLQKWGFSNPMGSQIWKSSKMRISIGPKSLGYLQLPNVVVENHKGIPMTWLQNVTEWLGVLAEVNGRGKDENNFREECKAKLVPTVEQSSHTPTPFLSKASPKSCILLRGFLRHEITSKKNTKNWRKKESEKWGSLMQHWGCGFKSRYQSKNENIFFPCQGGLLKFCDSVQIV